jgi:TRAP transporter TAXI family solute receptor
MHLHKLILLLTCFGIAACSRGPNEASLREELRARVNTEFSAGLFEINEFARRGSAPSSADGGDLDIYYTAELEFQRDYQLTAWKGLNLGTLAVVLGAKPAGIDGFKQEGNNRGDRLRVRGRLNYREVDGSWHSLRFAAPAKPIDPRSVEALERSGPASVLNSVRNLLERSPPEQGKSRDVIIVDELSDALGRIDRRLARLDGKLAFGTGWPAGTYNRFGKAFASYAAEKDFPVFNYASEGSIENGLSLQRGELDFALMQSDAAEVLYQGWQEVSVLPQSNLRSMASLWPEALHVVTLADSGIRHFNDLQGKRLAVGSLRSGTLFTAKRVWIASGLTVPDVARIQTLGLSDSISALEAREVDAVFIAGAVPEQALQNLVGRRQDVRFVPIDSSILEQLSSEHFAYYTTSIPAKTYPGQIEPYPTLGFAALLITSRNTRGEDVERFLDLLAEGAGVLAKDFYRAAFISRKTARLGISVPLHRGAERFYQRLEKRQTADSEARDSVEAP